MHRRVQFQLITDAQRPAKLAGMEGFLTSKEKVPEGGFSVVS